MALVQDFVPVSERSEQAGMVLASGGNSIGAVTERALQLHPQGCPAHQSVKDAIAITWDAALRVGDQTITVREAA